MPTVMRFDPARMEERRLLRRLSRRELAKLAGLDPANVTRYVQGIRVPSAGAVRRLAGVLRCQPLDLMSAVEEPTPTVAA